jgi:hypothetical protein
VPSPDPGNPATSEVADTTAVGDLVLTGAPAAVHAAAAAVTATLSGAAGTSPWTVTCTEGGPSDAPAASITVHLDCAAASPDAVSGGIRSAAGAAGLVPAAHIAGMFRVSPAGGPDTAVVVNGGTLTCDGVTEYVAPLVPAAPTRSRLAGFLLTGAVAVLACLAALALSVGLVPWLLDGATLTASLCTGIGFAALCVAGVWLVRRV